MNALADALTVPQKVKLTVEDFIALDSGGAFDGYTKSELIEGDVYGMNAQHTRHARMKSRLFLALASALRTQGLEAFVETSVAIPPHDVPEPDLIITDRPESEDLMPVAAVRLAIEVSDSTLRIDLGVKADLYARAGIPEYWVVDVTGGTLHQLWERDEAGYRQRRTVSLGTDLTSATIAGLTVELPTG
jgi:Uma2 family endonuclease